MTEHYSPVSSLPHIPDSLTVAQFMLRYRDPLRPCRNNVPCLIENSTGRRIGLKELRRNTFGLANAMSFKYNINENDVVMVFSPNHIDYAVVTWGVWSLGGVVTCANPSFTADELVYQLTSTKASLIIAHPSCIDTALAACHIVGLSSDRIVLFDPVHNLNFPYFSTVRELIADGLNRESSFVERTLDVGEAKTKLALLSFSSGTTGKPKAVAIPHYALIANVVQMAVHNRINTNCPESKNRGYRPGNVALGVLPFFHIAGFVINLHFVLFSAMSVVVMERYTLLDMLDTIQRYRITHVIIVPPQAVALCKHPAVKNYDLSSVKYVMVGAAPLSKEMNEQLFDVFPTCQVGQAYGMTETATMVAMPPMTQQQGSAGSAGQLIPGVEARIVKSDGTLAGEGEPGELVVKCPSSALGYTNNDQATKETFIDGWVRTGDEVIMNGLREIFVVDRLKEFLKVRGFQVAPAELEGCLLGHPYVADSCVVGTPDDYNGELPLAFVVLNNEAKSRIATDTRMTNVIKANIMKHVADSKARYKWLKDVEFVDVIPKNASGKLLRRVLRDRARYLRNRMDRMIILRIQPGPAYRHVDKLDIKFSPLLQMDPTRPSHPGRQQHLLC